MNIMLCSSWFVCVQKSFDILQMDVVSLCFTECH